MKEKLVLTVILGGIVVLPIRAMDTTPTVTIYIDYDAGVPSNEVFWATGQTSKMFSKIGTPVQFRSGRKAQTAGRSGLELDMYVGMQVPKGIHSNALGISHPSRQDGHIEVFYSRIENFTPDFCRSTVLAYIMAHEIAHALEGIGRHAPTGVMKAEWNFEDLLEIRVGTLEFDTSAVELIRAGIEKRVTGAHIAQLNSVSKLVR
ncbi:MAG TPA: hypothetical protein VH351_03065 [Bryobacteraceae bacterium]|jgi:hypothetical protein|nr:hypothetical protein [Bryobacteraceae bacterium]